MARWGLFLLGGLSLICGVIGLVLPLVPTTPFLLLSSYCFVRSSPRAHRWLLNHRWFGGYLRDWELHRGVRWHVKLLAVLSIAILLGLNWFTGALSLPLRITMTLLAVCGLLVIWRLPVVTAQAVTVRDVAARTAPPKPDLDLDLVA